jgi:hypothetical protein
VAGEKYMNVINSAREVGPRMYTRVSGDPAEIGHTGEFVIGVGSTIRDISMAKPLNYLRSAAVPTQPVLSN